jgi:hypothetical protein
MPEIPDAQGVYKVTSQDKLREAIVENAVALWLAGHNVVPTLPDKKPVVKWRAGVRAYFKEVEVRNAFGQATNIAVVGGCYDNEECTVILDIDEPGMRSILNEALGTDALRRLCGDANSLCVLTGPRPKGGVKCQECNGPTEPCKCVDSEGREVPLDIDHRGLAIVVRVPKGCAPERSIMTGKIDVLVNNYQVVYGPRTDGSFYTPFRVKEDGSLEYMNGWVGSMVLPSGVKLTCEEFKAITNAIEKALGRTETKKKEEKAEGAKETEETEREGFRRLSDDEKTALRELLVKLWVPGHRDPLLFSLAGWAAKAKPKPVDPLDFASVILDVMKIKGDEDDPRQRLGVILDTYVKAGFKITPDYFAPLGIRPYGPYAEEKPEHGVKGYTGVVETLRAMGKSEEEVLEIMKQLEAVFRVKSPLKRDMLWAKISENPEAYFIADYEILQIYRLKKKKKSGLEVDRYIAEGVPEDIEVYRNPFGGPSLFKLKWVAKILSRPLIIGPVMLEDVVKRLQSEGLVKARAIITDALSSLITEAIKAGRAVEKLEAPAPGFYYTDEGKLYAHDIDITMPRPEELRRALEALNELHDAYNHIEEIFLKVVKWGLVAPFAFAYKLRGRGEFIPGLYIWGATHTAKTTLAMIAVALYAKDPAGAAVFTAGSSVNTEARLGYMLEKSTLPLIVDEAGEMFGKNTPSEIAQRVIEMLKNSLTTIHARARYENGQYRTIPSLRTLVFTSNSRPPEDDALRRRLIIIYLSYKYRIPPEEKEKFNSTLLPRIKELNAIGRFIASRLLETGRLPDEPWDMAKLLPEAYRYAGLNAPAWVEKLLNIEMSTEENIEEVYSDVEDLVRKVVISKILDAYTKYTGKINTTPLDRLTVKDALLKIAPSIPWIILKAPGDISPENATEEETIVYILPGFLNEIEKEGGLGSLSGLKSLAEYLGWDYIPRLSIREGSRVTSRSVVKTTLREFLDFLLPQAGE